MGSKHEPSWTEINENPALESLRVRTQPCTVTLDPGEIVPLSAFLMLTADMMYG